MYRKTFEGMNCSIAHALDQIGEWWTLLIIRECTLGTTRFDEFQQRLGIARNVLTSRLNHLVENGILQKSPIDEGGRLYCYQLTPKGEAIYPILVALMQWGDKWIGAEPPIRLVDHRTGKPVEPVALRSVGGRSLGFRDIRLEAGPGATDTTRAVITARNRAVLGDGRAEKQRRKAR